MIKFWILIGIIVLSILVACGCWLGYGIEEHKKIHIVASVIAAIILVSLTIGIGLGWLKGTESGERTQKTWQSETDGGIVRVVKVYDCKGDLIQEYKGKFDVEYANGRVLFDDEKGNRHVIYFKTGTVTVDELNNQK